MIKRYNNAIHNNIQIIEKLIIKVFFIQKKIKTLLYSLAFVFLFLILFLLILFF